MSRRSRVTVVYDSSNFPSRRLLRDSSVILLKSQFITGVGSFSSSALGAASKGVGRAVRGCFCFGKMDRGGYDDRLTAEENRNLERQKAARRALKTGEWACLDAKCSHINQEFRNTCDKCGKRTPHLLFFVSLLFSHSFIL